MPLDTFDNLLTSISQSQDRWAKLDREKVLLDPFTYIASNPGKDIRGTLIAAFDFWLQVPKAQLEAITHFIETIHNASLMLDDIQDDSVLRRGKPVAHSVYGIPQTINAANYASILAYQKLLAIQVAEPGNAEPRLVRPANVSEIFADELVSLHHGQGLDILWRDTLTCPTEDEYITMARGKGSGALRLAVKLMMAFATTNVTVNYVPLVDLIGVYGQIRDDYMNLRSKQYTDEKGLADDISEGKFSFPVVHAIREEPESTVILDILKQRPKTPTLKHRAIVHLEDVTHSFAYTRTVLHSLEDQIREEIARLGGNPRLEALLNKLQHTSAHHL